MPRYTYTVDGTGANGATWFTEGTIETEMPGDFPKVPLLALQESYEKLTRGEAKFGDPTTCSGPYSIRRLTIIRED
jgi:hypothetical protein